jgi:hypothetical protein
MVMFVVPAAWVITTGTLVALVGHEDHHMKTSYAPDGWPLIDQV